MKKQDKQFKEAAKITIYKASKLSKQGRKDIAKWIKEKAKEVEKGDLSEFGSPFSYRYFYVDRTQNDK